MRASKWMTMSAAGLLAAGSLNAGSAEVTTSVDLASAYIFRGYTLSDKPVVQPSIEIALPVTIGVWGNLNSDDYGSDTSGQFTEIDIYADYTLPLSLDPFSISIGYTEYLYPSAGAGGDADREANIGLALDTLLSPSLSFYYGLDGLPEDSLYIELAVSHTVTIGEKVDCTIDCSVAFVDPDKGPGGFSTAKTGIDFSYSMFHAGVAYIAQLDDDALPDTVYDEKGHPTSFGYDEDLLFTLGIAKDF